MALLEYNDHPEHLTASDAGSLSQVEPDTDADFVDIRNSDYFPLTQHDETCSRFLAILSIILHDRLSCGARKR
ncbi:MAG: hypothetical protein HGA97_05870 [Chlorobiaceae bacterium]|nr:hypothetical protein [Chlorobiaceae bacterium]